MVNGDDSMQQAICNSVAKRSLSEITLCCIDTNHPNLAVLALEMSRKFFQFADTLLITTLEYNTPAFSDR